MNLDSKRISWVRPVAAFLLLTGATAVHAANPLLSEIEHEFVRLGEELRKIVVSIDVTGPVSEGLSEEQMEGLEDVFKYFGLPAPDKDHPLPAPRSTASGSGFLYDTQGHVVTNNHVIDGAELVEVHLWTGETLEAKVIGKDPQTDLAVIKIETKTELPAAVLGDSKQLEVGQFAIAVGNPRRLEGSLSYGHITALGRDGLRLPDLRFQDLIQTDAAINLGNSGGPLCNIDGQVIGVNTAIAYGAQSIGFAVPIETARRVIPVLIADGRVTRGYLGVKILPVKTFADAVGLSDDLGAYVDSVEPQTPAAAAGIQYYDVIRKVNGAVVDSPQDLVNKISELPPGAHVGIELWRDEGPLEVAVQLQEFPDGTRQPAREEAILGLRVQVLTSTIAERLGLDADTEGLVVAGVEPGSPADDAGILPGDVLLEFAKKPVVAVNDLRQLARTHATPGASVLIRLARRGESAGTFVIKAPGPEAPK